MKTRSVHCLREEKRLGEGREREGGEGGRGEYLLDIGIQPECVKGNRSDTRDDSRSSCSSH